MNMEMQEGWEDPQEEGMATSLQYSCLENSMGRGARRATIHRFAESDMSKATKLITQEEVSRCKQVCVTGFLEVGEEGEASAVPFPETSEGKGA